MNDNNSKKLKPYIKVRSASTYIIFPKQNLMLCIIILLKACTLLFKKDISTVFNTLPHFTNQGSDVGMESQSIHLLSAFDVFPVLWTSYWWYLIRVLGEAEVEV